VDNSRKLPCIKNSREGRRHRSKEKKFSGKLKDGENSGLGT
jgi:hypothetical protein